jgi:hypothetical protein
MALLTLVENAIRHGIDPGCDGGRVEVGARRGRAGTSNCGSGHRCRLTEDAGTGSGLRNLQERLQAFFPSGASVTLSGQTPHGVRADVRVTPAPTHERADRADRRRRTVAARAARRAPGTPVAGAADRGQARNGREAVEMFEDLQPQVAFLDVHMPGMNGSRRRAASAGAPRSCS